MSSALTYIPPSQQNPADIIRADTCDTRRHLPMPPLKGLRGTRTVTLFYRALSPDGDGVLSIYMGSRFVPTANYSLLTANYHTDSQSSASLTDLSRWYSSSFAYLRKLLWATAREST